MATSPVSRVFSKEEFQSHLEKLWEDVEGCHFDIFCYSMDTDDYENDLDRLRRDLEESTLWSLAVVCGKKDFVWYEIVKYQMELWLCEKCLSKQHQDCKCDCGLSKPDDK
jgi:hypothetical protein